MRQHSVNWSGTPVVAGQGPAATHLSLSGCGPRPHLFSKLCLGDQTKQTKIYYRIVYFYCFKCFRIVLKSKGNARLFSNFVWQRKCSQFLKFCLADGYADATYIRLVLKSKGNAHHSRVGGRVTPWSAAESEVLFTCLKSFLPGRRQRRRKENSG